MKVYGVTVSYYTGKLEAYLRYKGIPYTMDHHPFADQGRIKKQVGAIQVPIVERDDGRWMSDTTPMLLQLEQEHPEPSILPDSPSVRFTALLIEDYADEWLWRAAMHYRWSYEHDRELLSRILADEITHHLRLPALCAGTWSNAVSARVLSSKTASRHRHRIMSSRVTETRSPT